MTEKVKLMTDFSLEEFKMYCEEHFKKYEDEQVILNEINEFINLNEFQEISESGAENVVIEQSDMDKFYGWYLNVFNTYDVYYHPIRNWINHIRAVAEFRYGVDEDEKDPISQSENKELLATYRNIINEVADKFSTKELIAKKLSERNELLKEKAYQESLNVNVEGKGYKALKTCEVLWSGWECDNRAWVVDTGKEKKLVATNHGSTSFVSHEFLEGKIKEYEDAIASSKEMLKLLT